tara:strand:+ start:2291 stop:3070 length:780 start_codon:yes stop_codon:yes gene_type:complete
MSGWIKLHRKINKNPILKKNRIYSNFEAFTWLLLRVNYDDAKVVIGSRIYKVKKGELITSQKKLCKQFGWGNSRLRTFLKLLKNDGMIDFKSNTQLTQLILLNWESYQDTKSQTKSKQTTNKSQPNTNKKSKEIKKNKEVLTEQKFIDKVLAEGIKITPTVHPEIIDDFCNYWTEKNMTTGKMRFQLEKTFSIKRRLLRWNKNSFKFDPTLASEKVVKEKEDIVEKRYQEQMRRMKEADLNAASDDDIKSILNSYKKEK